MTFGLGWGQDEFNNVMMFFPPVFKCIVCEYLTRVELMGEWYVEIFFLILS